MERNLNHSCLISSAGVQDVPLIRSLAEMIFPITYQKILSEDQINYMMELMYHPNVLLDQMTNQGHHFLLIRNDSEDTVGFASFSALEDPEIIKLHKIYLLPSYQGQGIGKIFMEEICRQSRQNGARILELNVNRSNKALYFYENLGFYRFKTVDIPIGNHFYMNDFLMRLIL